MQRTAGNRAVVALLGGQAGAPSSTSAAPPLGIQRRKSFKQWRQDRKDANERDKRDKQRDEQWKQDLEKDRELFVGPESTKNLARALGITESQVTMLPNKIIMHPLVQKAYDDAALTAASKGQDAADAELLNFWETTKLPVQFDPKQPAKDIPLSMFRALAKTASEKMMKRIKAEMGAVSLKQRYESGVRSGLFTDTSGKQLTEQDDRTDTEKSRDSHQKRAEKGVTALGAIGTVGTVGSDVNKGVGKYILKDTTSEGPSNTASIKDDLGGLVTSIKDGSGGGVSGNLSSLGTDLKIEGADVWSKQIDTSSINDPNSINYQITQYKNAQEWTGGAFGLLSSAISLTSSICSLVATIADRKATAEDRAAAVHDTLANMTSTADQILTTVQDAEGSILTTNAFDWVPGLSIFSNAFTAIKSICTLVKKAKGLYQVNKSRLSDKLKGDEERDDFRHALYRLWVRASQQVEQDSFSIAKSLTNTALALAEVVTAGGFGIPRLASTAMSLASGIHNMGHMIADSIRAAASQKASTDYHAGHLKGSAENLIRTHPAYAVKAIIVRALDGDTEARGVLDAYGVKPPKDPATGKREWPTGSAPSLKQQSFQSRGPKGKQKTQENVLEYDMERTAFFEEANATLLAAFASDEQPKTIKQKIKDTLKGIKEAPGKLVDRYRQAKRIGAVRDELGYKKDETPERGGRWAFNRAVHGDDTITGIVETTTREIYKKYPDVPKDKKLTDANRKKREELLAKLVDEDTRKAMEQAKAGGTTVPTTDSGDMQQLMMERKLIQFWLDDANKMELDDLEREVSGGTLSPKAQPWYAMILKERQASLVPSGGGGATKTTTK